MKSIWNYPTTMWVGKDRIKDLSIACKISNMSKPLLVTDNGLVKSKIIFDAINNLKDNVFIFLLIIFVILPDYSQYIDFEIIERQKNISYLLGGSPLSSSN